MITLDSQLVAILGVEEPSVVALTVAVIAAAAALAGPIVTVRIQRRTQRENRSDHESVHVALLGLVADVRSLRDHVSEICSEQRSTSSTLDEHAEHLDATAVQVSTIAKKLDTITDLVNTKGTP